MVAMTAALIRGKARVQALDEVRNLNLWGQDIDDCAILASLPGVEVLSLSVNTIPSLRDFANLHQLRELYLRKNQVSDVADIRFLMRLPQLKVLWLSDNPCAAHPAYRATAVRNLPGLTKLDDQEVTPQERQQAQAAGLQLAAATDAEVAAVLAAAAEARAATGERSHAVSRQGSALSSRRQSAADSPKPPLPPGGQQQRQTSGALPHLTTVGTEVSQQALVSPSSGPESRHAHQHQQQQQRAFESGSSGGGGSKNVLYAVMALLAELAEADLMLVGRDVDARLSAMRGCG